MRTTFIIGVLASSVASLAVGQGSRGAPYIGGGFEAIGVGAAYERAYGLSLQAGYARQYSRLGLRFGGTYFERNRELGSGFVARPRAVGATVELTYDLTTSRFRPYLLGGWGLYRLSGTQRSGTTVLVVDQVSPAMIGGAGFRYRVGKRDLFGEARVHGLTNGRNWGSVFMPVTFGVRF